MPKLNILSKYGPVLLRLALAIVLIWFGTSQLLHPENWTRIVPAWANGIFGGADTVVHMNGYFEIIMAILLLAGIQVRIVGLILGLHLIAIASNFGLSPTGVRDWGLCLAAFSIFLNGPDAWSLDQKWLRSTL